MRIKDQFHLVIVILRYIYQEKASGLLVVIKSSIGTQVKLTGCKSALNPRWFILQTVLRLWSRCQSNSLLLCGLLYMAICFMFCIVLFCSCVFQSF